MSSVDRRKVLLMGKSGSGKTSMRSVIFSNYSAKDTKRLGATIDVEQSAVRFLGSLVLNLWDCGGQEAFLDNYLSAQKDTIFANVAVLIYVFDITSHEWEKDVQYFEDNLVALRENSAGAGVWVLINKMDLADKEDAGRTKYNERRREIAVLNERVVAAVADERAGGFRCFPTSIWDESLYKAWSSIIHTLIPNIALITMHLTYLRDLALAAEAALFESETFLIMAKSGSALGAEAQEFDAREVASGVGALDAKRFEKISEIVKGFRKTCHGQDAEGTAARVRPMLEGVFLDLYEDDLFFGFETKFEECTVVLEPLTKNTFIMLVSTDPRIEPAMLQYLIHNAQLHFVEIGTLTEIARKCGICRTSGEIAYSGDDDANAPAWDGPLER